MALDRKFVSEADRFLKQFDQAHPEPTPNQEREIIKHRELHEKRDNTVTDDASDNILDGF
ncbi:MAG: hypothetical protein COV52_06545 [Gammaproteobacteria bacterium CG11_big_fil_rev_8_21_14_0_20_46_22]|nr:MAG: hypothetical protein COW05_00590 [Gammaproteobacteria bacterium CG12_big_fil_rev_8_21_14_0_65_46_12]PIR10897.1 MAG: hypothetical protein COV52_06545 [Gammaproteobacteria bacterium CG11_big_fil_rev_8_21_14_0_20_46_22]